MTDSYDGPPLTRRERKERERAAAAAAAAAAGASSTEQPAEALVAEAQEAPVEQPSAPSEAASETAQPFAPVERSGASPDATEAPAAVEVPPRAVADESMPATEAIDMSTVLGGRGRPRPATQEPPAPEQAAPEQAAAEQVLPAQEPPTEPASATQGHDDVDDVFAAALSEEPHEDVEEAQASRGFGRFFGRRKDEDATVEAGEQDVLDHDDPLGSLARAADDAADGGDEERVQPAAPEDVSVPRPSRAVPTSSLPVIDVQGLDTVDDDEVDRVEIDEVQVEDRRPVSSRWIAEATPAELEDRRAAEEAQEEADDAAGPRRAGRAPVVVNVVADTSEHHISDLRAAETASIASASSVGTGTSTITANALVLPASGAHEPIEIAGDDGVIVTGSIDLPDGFASSGRTRGTIDTADVDASVDDPGELRSPETQPVRASKAVSSYANARVQIAPQRRSSNTLPIAIGVGGGVVVLGIAAVTTMAVVFGWF